MEKYTCEFCGKKTIRAASNSFHGYYCEECIRLNNRENIESLASIRVDGRKRNADRMAKKQIYNYTEQEG